MKGEIIVPVCLVAIFIAILFFTAAKQYEGVKQKRLNAEEKQRQEFIGSGTHNFKITVDTDTITDIIHFADEPPQLDGPILVFRDAKTGKVVVLINHKVKIDVLQEPVPPPGQGE